MVKIYVCIYNLSRAETYFKNSDFAFLKNDTNSRWTKMGATKWKFSLPAEAFFSEGWNF